MGLYYRGMRALSGLQWRIAGRNLRSLASSSEKNYKCEVWLANPSLAQSDGSLLDARLVSFKRTLILWRGLHEEFEIQNCSGSRVSFDLSLDLSSDYLDVMEIRGLLRRERGAYHPVDCENGRFLFTYEGKDGVRRSTAVTFSRPPDEFSKSEIEFAPGRSWEEIAPSLFDTRWENEENWEGSYRSDVDLEEASMPPSEPMKLRASWRITLEPQQHWVQRWKAIPTEDSDTPALDVSFEDAHRQVRKGYEEWLQTCVKVTTSNHLLNDLFERALLDLRMLMQSGANGPVPVAGLPWFDAVFGRDSLLCGLQVLWLNPEIAVNTLHFLAAHQATEDDPWRDAEPGKIPHEVREGEMAGLGEIPHGCYYGSVDATLLFLVLFSETYRWIGEDRRLLRLLPAVERCIEWIERTGRTPEDGYIRWQSRSSVGIRNQGWKDSRTSLLVDGKVPGEIPAALVEVQGYAYRAYRETADVLRRRNPVLANKLDGWADALQTRFLSDFWMPDEHFLIQAIDARGRKIRSITSNAGQTLFAGLLDDDSAGWVIKRLMESDLYSGWGIRTLSKHEPGYNPMSYHNGSVWYHDTALIAAGMKDYGFSKEVAVLARGLFEASLFQGKHPFPELVCGFDRSEGVFSVPGDYPASCPVQAWAAGAPFQLLQAILGLRVGSDRRLHVAPDLPEWLRWIELEGLHVGGKPLHLYFSRDERGNTVFKILDNPGKVEVVVIS